MTSSPSTTELRLDDTWAYGAGVLHGGWLPEVVTEVALRSTGHPQPLAVSAHHVAALRFGPATVELGIGGRVPTVELTVLLRCSPVDGWLRVVPRARSVHVGWLDEECEVWDSAGHMLVQAHQLAGCRELAA